VSQDQDEVPLGVGLHHGATLGSRHGNGKPARRTIGER
jgi:hypothetical protein